MNSYTQKIFVILVFGKTKRVACVNSIFYLPFEVHKVLVKRITPSILFLLFSMSVLEDIRGLVNRETQKPQEYNAIVKVEFNLIVVIVNM